jgi:hypothetical protein
MTKFKYSLSFNEPTEWGDILKYRNYVSIKELYSYLIKSRMKTMDIKIDTKTIKLNKNYVLQS